MKFIVPFVDILCALLVILMSIMALSHPRTSTERAGLQQNAIYQLVLTWKGEDDLDMHVADSQKHKVSFQRREGGEGSLFSLNRDSLGASRTETDAEGKLVNPVNEEIVSIRGIIPGEYICNLHAFAKKQRGPVEATVKLVRNKPFKEIVVKTRVFSNSGEEQTAFRFSLDKDGQVTDLNELPAQIVYSKDEEPEMPSVPEPPPPPRTGA